MDTIIKNDIVSVSFAKNGNFVRFESLMGELVLKGSRTVSISPDPNNEPLFFDLIMQLFPVASIPVDSIDGDYYNIKILPDALAVTFFNRINDLIESDDLNNDYNTVLGSFKKFFDSKNVLTDEDFFDEVKNCFPINVRETVGKRFAYTIFQPHIYNSIEPLVQFIIINELVAHYLNTGENLAMKELVEECNFHILESSLLQFKTLNISSHEFTEHIADMLILDLSTFSSSDNYRIIVSHIIRNYLKSRNYTPSKNNSYNSNPRFRDSIAGMSYKDSNVSMFPSFLDAKAFVSNNQYYGNYVDCSVFGNNNPIHIFNRIPSMINEHFKDYFKVRDSRLAEYYLHHNIFTYMENNFTQDELLELEGIFELVSEVSIHTVPGHPEFAYSYSYIVFLFLASLKRYKPDFFQGFKSDREEFSLKLNSILENFYVNKYSRWLTPFQVEELALNFSQNTSSNTIPLLVNIMTGNINID